VQKKFFVVKVVLFSLYSEGCSGFGMLDRALFSLFLRDVLCWHA
jgi:hypothetical protein